MCIYMYIYKDNISSVSAIKYIFIYLGFIRHLQTAEMYKLISYKKKKKSIQHLIASRIG